MFRFEISHRFSFRKAIMGSRNGVLLQNVVPVSAEISIASSAGENPDDVDIESLLLFLEISIILDSDTLKGLC